MQYRVEEGGVDGMIILKCKYVWKASIVFISLGIENRPAVVKKVTNIQGLRGNLFSR